jgi:hypothetical protein
MPAENIIKIVLSEDLNILLHSSRLEQCQVMNCIHHEADSWQCNLKTLKLNDGGICSEVYLREDEIQIKKP